MGNQGRDGGAAVPNGKQPFGQFLKATRKARRLTLEALGAALGVSRGIVQHWEVENMCRLSLLGRLCKLLGVAVMTAEDAEQRFDIRWAERDLTAGEPDDGAGVDAEGSSPSGQTTGTGAATLTATGLDMDVVIEEDFASWTPDRQARFLEGLRLIMGEADEIRVTRKRRGSVRLTLRLTPEQAERLVRVYAEGRLAPLGVSRVEPAESEASAESAPDATGSESALVKPPWLSDLKEGELLWVRLVAPSGVEGFTATIVARSGVAPYSPPHPPTLMKACLPLFWIPSHERQGVRVGDEFACTVISFDWKLRVVMVSRREAQSLEAQILDVADKFEFGRVCEAKIVNAHAEQGTRGMFWSGRVLLGAIERPGDAPTEVYGGFSTCSIDLTDATAVAVKITSSPHTGYRPNGAIRAFVSVIVLHVVSTAPPSPAAGS